MRTERWYPVGFPWAKERSAQRAGLILACAAALLFFLCQFQPLVYVLYISGLGEEAVMPPFPAFLGGFGFPFLVLALCQPAVALAHYLYHYQGGRSIYRMRTLPQRGELGRRCLAAPAAALGRCILAALGTAALCALYYRILTPAGALPAHWLGGALCWN